MRHATVLALLLVSLVGCSKPEPPATSEPTLTLEAWKAPGPTATEALSLGDIKPVATPGPSPTPLVHEIRAGDTLLGVAIEYGVELNDLLVANPGVNPRFLSIGQQLIIPGPGGEPAAGLLPTPTPIPVALSEVDCYPMLEGGLRCLTTASYDGGIAIEGLVALITLTSKSGEALQTEPAYSPINLLIPGEVVPLVAIFDAPPPLYSAAKAKMVSAVPANEVPERYAALEWVIDEELHLDSPQSRSVAGRLMLAEPNDAASLQATLLLLALSPTGKVVGYRMEEIEVRGETPFELIVSTLGPEIAETRLLAEALLLP